MNDNVFELKLTNNNVSGTVELSGGKYFVKHISISTKCVVQNKIFHLFVYVYFLINYRLSRQIKYFRFQPEFHTEN